MSEPKKYKVVLGAGIHWRASCLACGAFGGFHCQTETDPHDPWEFAKVMNTHDRDFRLPEEPWPCREDGCDGTVTWAEIGPEPEREIRSGGDIVDG